MSQPVNQADQVYVPGVCNINPAEVAYRRKARNISLTIAAVLFMVLVFTPLQPLIRGLIVFLPLYIGVVGYYQVKNRFCVGYGASGMQNAAGNSMTASAVDDEQARTKDRAKARSINGRAALITAVAVAVSIVIPHI